MWLFYSSYLRLTRETYFFDQHRLHDIETAPIGKGNDQERSQRIFVITNFQLCFTFTLFWRDQLQLNSVTTFRSHPRIERLPISRHPDNFVHKTHQRPTGTGSFKDFLINHNVGDFFGFSIHTKGLDPVAWAANPGN